MVFDGRLCRKMKACSTCKGEGKCLQDLGKGKLKEEDSVEDVGFTGGMILKFILKCMMRRRRLD
jgi:hypothetical protein